MRNLMFAGIAVAGLLPFSAAAQGSLNVLCSVQAEWCQTIATEFQKETGVRVAIVQKGSGEVFAQIKAEAANPRTDLWFGGTGDPHLQAADEQLSEVYRSPRLGELHEWAQKQAADSGYRTVGIYAGALGFGYNTEILTKKKLAAPKCWADLAKVEYKNEAQVANPNSSGTAYTMIATLVQVMGEDQAFDFMKKMHQSMNTYTKSGTGPIKAVARGETTISISFMHDGITEAVAGFPVAVAAPCEGTGYEVGSMSIVKGARNLDNAKKFYDWALGAQAQALGAKAKQFQTPSNKAAPLPPGAPKLSDMKLIAYDFKKYGTSAERRRLIDKWEKEINALPK